MLNDLKIEVPFSHGDAAVVKSKDLRPDLERFAINKVVFLYRDPRDVVISWYFHTMNVMNLHELSLEDFLRDERWGIGKICEFNDRWLTHQEDFPGFPEVSYEDMHSGPLGTLRRVVNFLGFKGVSDAAIRRVIDKNDFAKMKVREKKGVMAALYPGRFAKEQTTDDAMKVRRGKVKGYVDYLSEEDIAYCDEVCMSYPSISERWNGAHKPG